VLGQTVGFATTIFILACTICSMGVVCWRKEEYIFICHSWELAYQQAGTEIQTKTLKTQVE